MSNLSIHRRSTMRQRNTNSKSLPIVLNSNNEKSYTINNLQHQQIQKSAKSFIWKDNDKVSHSIKEELKSIHQTSLPTNTGSKTNLPMDSSKKQNKLELTTIKTQTSIDNVHHNISIKTLKQKTKSIKKSTDMISEVRGSNTNSEMDMINEFDKSRKNSNITLRGAFKMIIDSRMNYSEYVI